MRWIAALILFSLASRLFSQPVKAESEYVRNLNLWIENVSFDLGNAKLNLIIRIGNGLPFENSVTYKCKSIHIKWLPFPPGDPAPEKGVFEEDIFLSKPFYAKWNDEIHQSISIRLPQKDDVYWVELTPALGQQLKIERPYNFVRITLKRHNEDLYSIAVSSLGFALFVYLVLKLTIKKFRLHLSTFIVVIFVAGTLIGLDSRNSYIVPVSERMMMHRITFERLTFMGSQGWPFPVRSQSIEWSWKALAVDTAFFTTVLFIVAATMESFYKRFSHSK